MPATGFSHALSHQGNSRQRVFDNNTSTTSGHPQRTKKNPPRTNPWWANVSTLGKQLLATLREDDGDCPGFCFCLYGIHYYSLMGLVGVVILHFRSYQGASEVGRV
jgi:hypothetical protein